MTGQTDEYNAIKPREEKPAWWHAMVQSSPKTDLDKAKAMLRDEFIKQPLLTVYFTAETWRLPLVHILWRDGYLQRRPINDPTTVTVEFRTYDITPKAFAELRDGGIVVDEASFYNVAEPLVPRR